MFRFVFAVALLLPLPGMSAAVLAADEKPAEKSVVVPQDNKPFKVDKDSIVRLTGKGIAGSQIDVKVTGPAKVAGINEITERVNGQIPIGTTVTEFNLKSTGAGKVIVELTVKPPTGKTTVTKYEYQVE